MYLLGHWERETIFSMPFCDGAVLGHHGYLDAEIRAYVLNRPGFLLFDYFNVWQMPLDEWMDGTNPWFEFIGHHAPYLNAAGLPIRERFMGRIIQPWANVDPYAAADVVMGAKTLRNPLGHGGYFLDCWQPELTDWMSDDIAAMDPEIKARHELHLRAFKRVLNRSAAPVLINGAWGSGEDLQYMEDTGGRISWGEGLARWRGLNVLSVVSDNMNNVARAIDEWGPGKWLAFTEISSTNGPEAYRRAQEHRQRVLGGPGHGG